MQIQDEATLWKVIEKMKEQKVSSFSMEGLHVVFAPQAFAAPVTPFVEPEQTEEQKKKAAEEILYHSAG